MGYRNEAYDVEERSAGDGAGAEDIIKRHIEVAEMLVELQGTFARELVAAAVAVDDYPRVEESPKASVVYVNHLPDSAGSRPRVITSSCTSSCNSR